MNRAAALFFILSAASGDRWAVHYTEKVIEVVDSDGTPVVTEGGLRAAAGVGPANDPLTRWKVLWAAGDAVRRNNRTVP